MVKKVVLVSSMLCCVCLHSMDRLKSPFPKPRNSPKGSPKSRKLTDSDGSGLSPHRPVGNLGQLKDEFQKIKDEKRNSSEQK